MGRKLGWGVSAPFFGEGSSVPVLYSVARDEAYLHAKFHLDLPTVWPQYTNVTDRQDRPQITCKRFINVNVTFAEQLK